MFVSTPVAGTHQLSQHALLKRRPIDVNDKIGWLICCGLVRFAAWLCRMVVGRSDLLAKKENVVKFVCVAFWKQIHGKAADRLSRVKADSSHYVIEDSSFSFFKPLATPDGVDVRDVAGKYTMFSKGAIRGCLTALGVAGSVQVDWTTKFPAIRFQLLLNPAAAVEGE